MPSRFNGIPVYPHFEQHNMVVPGGTDYILRTFVRVQDSEGAYYMVKVMERFHCEEGDPLKTIRTIQNLYTTFMHTVWQIFMFCNVNVQILDQEGHPIYIRDPDQSAEKPANSLFVTPIKA